MPHLVCRIAGDGAGPELMNRTCDFLARLNTAVGWKDAEAGWRAWEKHQTSISPFVWRALDDTSACLYGTVRFQPGVRGYSSPLAEIRKRKKLFASFLRVRIPLRAAAIEGDSAAPTSLPPAPSAPPFAFSEAPPSALPGGLHEIALWRAAGEDHQAGIEFPAPLPGDLARLHAGFAELPEGDWAASVRVVSRQGCRSLCEAALAYAAARGRKRVTCVHRAALLRETDGLFVEEFRRAAANYPQLECREESVPAALTGLIERPADYDVIAAPGMWGELLAAALLPFAGGPAIAAAAEIGPGYALFQPLHGPALEIAGQGRVNPLGMLRAAALLLEYLGETSSALALDDAIEAIAAERPEALSLDLGSPSAADSLMEDLARRLGLQP